MERAIRKTFQSTSLSRGKTAEAALDTYIRTFQSTSLSRGKTPQVAYAVYVIVLSIHFPLTREDIPLRVVRNDFVLSIHFPLTREDYWEAHCMIRKIIFQSTSLSRGKTRLREKYLKLFETFNPLPSHEGRQ